MERAGRCHGDWSRDGGGVAMGTAAPGRGSGPARGPHGVCVWGGFLRRGVKPVKKCKDNNKTAAAQSRNELNLCLVLKKYLPKLWHRMEVSSAPLRLSTQYLPLCFIKRFNGRRKGGS